MPAAIFMAQTHALLRAEAARAGSPREVMQQVNRHLLTMNDVGLFVTVLYGVLDRTAGTFAYVRAGHELPLAGKARAGITSAPQGESLPLGIDADPPLDEQTVALPPGSTLLLYTDGIVDARDPHGVRFGIERLKAALQACVSMPAGVVCDHLLQTVLGHQAAAPQYDDATLVTLQRAG